MARFEKAPKNELHDFLASARRRKPTTQFDRDWVRVTRLQRREMARLDRHLPLNGGKRRTELLDLIRPVAQSVYDSGRVYSMGGFVDGLILISLGLIEPNHDKGFASKRIGVARGCETQVQGIYRTLQRDTKVAWGRIRQQAATIERASRNPGYSSEFRRLAQDFSRELGSGRFNSERRLELAGKLLVIYLHTRWGKETRSRRLGIGLAQLTTMFGRTRANSLVDSLVNTLQKEGFDLSGSHPRWKVSAANGVASLESRSKHEQRKPTRPRPARLPPEP